MPCNITEKLEEGRVFFEVYPPPGRGEVAEAFTPEREFATALIEKEKWEKAHPGFVLIKFHKDPFAGGLRTELMANTAITGLKPGRADHPLEVEGISEDNNNPEGSTKMVAYPLWVGEVIVRQFKDQASEDAWKARNK